MADVLNFARSGAFRRGRDVASFSAGGLEREYLIERCAGGFVVRVIVNGQASSVYVLEDGSRAVVEARPIPIGAIFSDPFLARYAAWLNAHGLRG